MATPNGHAFRAWQMGGFGGDYTFTAACSCGWVVKGLHTVDSTAATWWQHLIDVGHSRPDQ